MKHSSTPRTVRFAFAVLLAFALANVARAGEHRFPDYSYESTQSVSDAQTVLQSEHYLKPGGYTRGTMDPQTVAALREFQAAHLLPSNGRLDRDTMAMLMSHLNVRSPRIATETHGATTPGSAREGGTTERPEGGSSRLMPVTGSALPYPIAIGAVLLTAGVLLYRRGL